MLNGGRKNAKEMKGVVISLFFTIVLSGCYSGDITAACSGVNLISGVENGRSVERSVPITFSLRITRTNSLMFWEKPLFKATINNYFFSPEDNYLYENTLSGNQRSNNSEVFYRYEMDTKVLFMKNETAIAIGKLRYLTVDNFSGKCS